MKININESQFNRLILEKHFSDLIYHFTSLDNLSRILEDDMLTYSFDTYADNNYSISLTTTKSSQFGFPYFSYSRMGSFARITLDGRMLNYNHTGKRYQYYKDNSSESSVKGNPEYYKPEMSYDEYKKKHNGSGVGYESNFNPKAQHMMDYESEDRIMRNSHEDEGIKPIKPYIIRIDIFICGDDFEEDIDYLYKIKQNFDSSKVFIYKDLKYFDMQRKKNSYSIDDVLKKANLQ